MLQNEMPNANWLVKDHKKDIRKIAQRVKIPLSSQDEMIMKKLIDFVKLSQDKKWNKDNKLRPAVGLAAPQIGANKQMYYIKITKNMESKKNIEHALINPEIIGTVKQQVALKYGEGCLSVDKEHDGFVVRSYKVVVQAYDYLKKKHVKIIARDYEAIVLQHEQDHLEGKLYYDLINDADPWENNNNVIYI